jgi:membrane-associated protease RseP (regulator of RpoE activity)
MPVVVAGFAGAIIFGLSHNISVLYVCVTFAMGLMLTAVYEWRKTLLAPILVHAGINFIAAVGMALMMIQFATGGVLGVGGDPRDAECVIREIGPNSAAEEAGLQVGDIIKSFNAEPIRDFPHLVETVPLYRPGDAIPVTVSRSGAEFEVTVVLQGRGTP